MFVNAFDVWIDINKSQCQPDATYENYSCETSMYQRLGCELYNSTKGRCLLKIKWLIKNKRM